MASLASRRATTEIAKSFWTSDFGRNCVRITGVVIGGGSFTLAVAAHTWGIVKYRDIVQHYEDGLSVKMTQKLVEFREQVLDDMNIAEKYRQGVKLFHNCGFEPFSIGSLKMKYGIFLGVPKNVAYDEPRDIDRNLIQINDESVIWESEDGEELAQALILSDRAKKFVMAQQIFLTDSYYVWIKSAITSGTVFLYQYLTITGNEKFYGFYKPKSFRVFMYTVAGFFCYGVWTAAMDIYQRHLEKSSDKKAASLGIDYARGGVEHYTKMLKRNIAMRSLMGPEQGPKAYTQLGNLNIWIRQKHIPYTERKENAERNVESFFIKSENITSSQVDVRANKNNSKDTLDPNIIANEKESL